LYRKDEDFIQRSIENLVEVYREELLKIIEGYNCVDFISTGVRRRLREEGILKKFGSKYTVSQLGRKMLKVEKAMEVHDEHPLGDEGRTSQGTDEAHAHL